MPILGGYGNISEYAYRGFIDDVPDPFDWVDLYNVKPGKEYKSGYAKVTGIKRPLPIRVKTGFSFSLISNVFDNGQTVSFDNDDLNQASFDEYSDPNDRFQPGLGIDVINGYVKNNQSINLSVYIPESSEEFSTITFDSNRYRFDQYNPRFSTLIEPVSSVDGDFAVTFTALVYVGRFLQDWIVQTKVLDDDPDPFKFLRVIESQTSTINISNPITITGFEPYYRFPANIASGNQANLIIDGKPSVGSTTVHNGSIIQIQATSSNLFDFTKNIDVIVGTFTTTWTIRTELERLYLIFAPIEFTNQSNLQLNTNYDSNQITISGLSLNSDLQVILSNSNASYEVERSGSVVKSFTDSPIQILNFDKIRLRLRSSSSYNTSVSTRMTIGNTFSDWVLTTRESPPPSLPPTDPICRTEGESDLAYFIGPGGDSSGVTLGLDAVNSARECGFSDCEIVNLAISQGKRFDNAAQLTLNCSTENPISCRPSGWPC